MKEIYDQSFNALRKIGNVDLSQKDSFDVIMKIINEEVIIPFVTLTIPKGAYLFRARINSGCSFTFKDELSYNTNLSTIGIGRANYFHQPIFYASHKNETAIFETSNIIRKKKFNEVENITVGRWFVKKPISVFAIVNNHEYLKKGEAIQQKYFEFLQNNSELSKPEVKEHMDFIAKEFAKKVTDENEYKISCAFFNAMMERSYEYGNISGVAFPTVEWEKNDLNIAIIPEAVDDALILDTVGEFKVQMEKEMV